MIRLGQAPTAILRGVIDDTYLSDIALRNQQRAQQLITLLGTRYACHPTNAPRKKVLPQTGVLK